MKVPLETTTVREMLSKGGECLLCDLEAKAEAQLIRYFLGNSVMQPQIRVKVNRSGFCAPHFQALYKEGNRLGLALITHTHLLETWKRIREREKGLDNPSPNASGAPNGKALKRSSAGKRQRANAAGLIRLLKDRKEACLICRRLEETVRGYAFATVYLWEKDPEFRQNLLASRGFCLPHLAVTHELAGENLSRSTLQNWYSDILALQQRSFDRIEKELKSFINRYDYRSEEPQPEKEKTVLPRAIQKLAGRS